MKILVLLHLTSSAGGGAEWSLLDVCQSLAQRGHELHCVYLGEGDLFAKYQECCKSFIKVRHYRILDKKPISSINFISSILRVLNNTSFDVIYANYYLQTFFGGSLAQLKRVPLVCHLRSLPPQGQGFPMRTRFGLKSVTRFISVSEATRLSYLSIGFDPKSIDVVYNGIDLNRFAIANDRERTRQALGLPPEAFVVLYAGRIVRPKNIEMPIEAFARLGLPAERARLLVVGAPYAHANTPEEGEPYLQELKSLCDRLGIGNSVHWLGSRSDLPQLYRAADVSVLPSMLPETFGRVLVESMACGTPALGLRFGGIPEVLSGEFEKFQFQVGDISGLTNLLQSLNGWQQNDPTLGQRCRTYVEERFPRERMAEGVERILQQAVAQGGVRLGPSIDSLQPWQPDSLGI